MSDECYPDFEFAYIHCFRLPEMQQRRKALIIQKNFIKSNRLLPLRGNGGLKTHPMSYPVNSSAKRWAA